MLLELKKKENTNHGFLYDPSQRPNSLAIDSRKTIEHSYLDQFGDSKSSVLGFKMK